MTVMCSTSTSREVSIELVHIWVILYYFMCYFDTGRDNSFTVSCSCRSFRMCGGVTKSRCWPKYPQNGKWVNANKPWLMEMMRLYKVCVCSADENLWHQELSPVQLLLLSWIYHCCVLFETIVVAIFHSTPYICCEYISSIEILVV